MPGPSFADLLDEAVRGAEAEAAGAASRAWASAPQPGLASPLLFAGVATSPTRRWLALPEARPHRVAHRLTATERHAFDLLAGLGARLAADFTADELRREFRRLAQRYHPDRHGAASAGELESLSRRFSEATDGYRCLRAVVDARH